MSIAMPSSVAGLMPAWRVRGPRGVSPSSDCPAAQGCAAAQRPASPGYVDTLEISREAEVKLLGQLSEAEQRVVQDLKSADRGVRAHEQAHLAAAGPYATGGPSYRYVKGPDGRRYATAGELQIDTTPVEGDPEATLRKAQVIRAAAMAPSHPSAQDRQVAAAASRMEAEARQELQEQQRAEREGESEPGKDAAEDPLGSLVDVFA